MKKQELLDYLDWHIGLGQKIKAMKVGVFDDSYNDQETMRTVACINRQIELLYHIRNDIETDAYKRWLS